MENVLEEIGEEVFAWRCGGGNGTTHNNSS